MRNNLLLVTLAALVVQSVSFAQETQSRSEAPKRDASNHVTWTMTVTPETASPGGKAQAKLTAKIDEGWHLYSLTTPPGPIPTTIKLSDSSPASRLRVFQPKPVTKFDPNFNADTETYEGSTVFLLELTLNSNSPVGMTKITVKPRYQVCSATSCIPPVTREVTAELNVENAAKSAAALPAIPADYKEAKPGQRGALGSTAGSGKTDFGFLALAFGFGLAAIFTPCVFPMIPITMSFFLNQENTGRSGALMQALTFCIGIIVLFSGFGLAATALLGPFGVVQLGSNPWVNALIVLIFLVFGLSLLGAFEITIPSGILTKLNSASQGGGWIGTLFMGLTFALASFACVGPFMGTLLAASVQGGGLQPLFGMVSFSSGLAAPFFLLALFPSYLKKLPRSGGWMSRVKIVMGFVVLAAALKYFSAIDRVLQWNFLTRERFLAAWVVLFAMAGLYLLGFLRMEGVSKDDDVGWGRLLIGIFLVAFSISLVPGMFGKKLGELEAYVPPREDSDLAWIQNDLQGALERAGRENKLVLVNFTGYACTNCHWMKANMFTRPEIASSLKNMILVDLYTDGTDSASEANQKLEQSAFGTIAIPFYVIYTADKQVVATFPGLTRNPQEYLTFLNTQAPAKPVAEPVPTSSSSVTGAIQKGSPLKESAAVNPLDGVTLTDLAGKAFDSSPLAGKVLVVNFWATWCVPCRREIPEFNKLQQSEAGKGIAVVGISRDEDGAEVVGPFLQGTPMRYTVLLGSGDAVAKRFSVDQLPVTLIFDRTGKQVQRFDGFTKPELILAAVNKAS